VALTAGEVVSARTQNGSSKLAPPRTARTASRRYRVTPDPRGVAASWNDGVEARFVYDQPISSELRELVSDAETEVVAGFPLDVTGSLERSTSQKTAREPWPKASGGCTCAASSSALTRPVRALAGYVGDLPLIAPL
jgi:hypothetical protein